MDNAIADSDSLRDYPAYLNDEESHFNPLQAQCIAACRQYMDILTHLDKRTMVASVMGSSSIGMHIRHVIDRFNCLIDGVVIGVVDYDNRARDGRIEEDIDFCKAALKEVQSRLLQLPYRPVLVIKETASIRDLRVTAKTTIEREILAVINHSTHHMAMIRLLAHAMGIRLNAHYGLAPSTLKYLKKEQENLLKGDDFAPAAKKSEPTQTSLAEPEMAS